jgi:ATP-dependent DNA helicase RecG
MKFPLIESKNLEFKEFLEDYRRAAESVVAFANARGGEIIIGIRDIDREVVGLSESQVLKYQEEIPPALVDQISPQLAVDTFARNIEGMVCLVVKVFPGPHKPYFVSRLGYPKGIFMRYGSHNRPADEYAVRDLERARNHASFEQMLTVGAAFDGLSTLMLDKIIHNTSAETFVAGGYGALDVDQKIKATNGGVLLFHPRPCTFIPEAYVTVTRYS